jgi:hypothetical protein
MFCMKINLTELDDQKNNTKKLYTRNDECQHWCNVVDKLNQADTQTLYEQDCVFHDRDGTSRHEKEDSNLEIASFRNSKAEVLH